MDNSYEKDIEPEHKVSMEKSLFANLQAMIRQYRGRFVKAFLMVLTSNVLLIANPLIFRQAVNAVTTYSGSHLFFVFIWAGILITVAAIASYFKYWMRMEFIAISRDAEKEIRSMLFERIQLQSRAFFDHHGIGELLSRLTNDITAYRDLIGPGIMYPLFFITLVLPGMIALFTISVNLASLALVPLVLLPLLNMSVRKQIFMLSQAVQEAFGKMSNMVQEHFAGIRIVKGYGIESNLFNRFCRVCRGVAVLSIRLSCLQGMLLPLFTLFTKIVTVLLVLFSGFIILKAWSDLNVADFISFMWIQSYIFFPILMLGWVLPVYERGKGAYQRLVEIYEEPIEVKDNPESTLQIPFRTDIHIDHLTFSYSKTLQPALSNISLKIKGGSFVGITGPIGAGKTTLFRIINREYEIPRGTVYIGENDIHDYSLATVHEAIVMVEQNAFLFSKSVGDNVRFGKAEASQEELEEVARFADLHDTVMSFPERYDTVVGERGVTLSGGQKQRVAMARAFLVNRSILLLDDIFSAVDSETEKRIFTAISKNFKNKTVLLITHRTSILQQLDRVIYMTEGKIVEDGTPEELIKKKGHYAALVDLQRLALQ